MKTLLKLTLVAALIICSNTTFAQKFGYINSSELITAMPERDSMQVKIEALANELGEMYEAIQVEFNNKLAEYQKGAATMSDKIKELKEADLTALQERLAEFQRTAQADIQKEENKLMEPIITKAKEAIETVAKKNSLTVVFDTASGSLAYFDKSTLVDILPLVKDYLGIKDKPATEGAN